MSSQAHPQPCPNFDTLKAQLLEQIRPEGQLELQTFDRYVFAVFQSARSRQFEWEAQQRWLNEPGHPSWFHQMERLQKLTSMLERRADKALSEIRKLQRDRFASLDVLNELHLLNNPMPVPATLPVAEIRRSNQSRTSPLTIAMQLLANSPDVLSCLREQSSAPPPDPVSLSTDDLLRLHSSATS